MNITRRFNLTELLVKRGKLKRLIDMAVIDRSSVNLNLQFAVCWSCFVFVCLFFSHLLVCSDIFHLYQRDGIRIPDTLGLIKF